MQPPIADPQNAPVARFAPTDARFYVQFLPWFASTWLSSVAFFPFFALMRWVRFAYLPQSWLLEFAYFVLLTGAFQLVLTALVRQFTPIRMNAWGLRAYTLMLTPKEQRWSQIVSVKSRWLIVSYAVVSTADGPNLWIPLPMQDMPGFTRAVAAHTAPDHPLHAFLLQRDLLGESRTPRDD